MSNTRQCTDPKQDKVLQYFESHQERGLPSGNHRMAESCENNATMTLMHPRHSAYDCFLFPEKLLNQQASGDWPCSMLLKGTCPASTTLARTLLVLNHNTKGIQAKPATRFGCRLRLTLRSTFLFTRGGSLTFAVSTRVDQTAP